MSALGVLRLVRLASSSILRRRSLRRAPLLPKARRLKLRREKGRSTLAQPSTPSDLPIDYWASHRPGDDVIPANAERVEWASGLVLFQGTRHHPLILFGTEHEAQRQEGQPLRLWRTEFIQHEHDSLDSFRTVGGLISPNPVNLPRLSPWAAPNGWDYWGRP